MDRPRHDTILLQAAQGDGKHAARYAGECAPDLVEALRPVRKADEGQDRPFTADDIERPDKGSGRRRGKGDWTSHRWRHKSHAPGLGRETGSASCRERVCQYV